MMPASPAVPPPLPLRLVRLAGEIAEAVILLQGWRRNLAAVAAGGVAALALAPFNLLPALLLAFPVLVWLIDGAALGQGRRRIGNALAAGLVGWFFGFGYFVAGLWWLGVAFITGGEEFLFLMPLGVIGLPMVLALFMALGTAIAGFLWSGGAGRLAALAFGLGVSEWLRGWVFTGFPWNSFGQVFANHLLLAQGASVIGAEGLALVAILVAASPATIGTGSSRPGRWLAPALAILLMAIMAGFGLARLSLSGGIAYDPARMPSVPDVRLRIMQPNVQEHERRQPNAGITLLRRYLDLSARVKGPNTAGLGEITHLVWPEAPFPFVLEREPRALRMIADVLGTRTRLVTGAVRAEDIADAPEGTRALRYFNALQVYEAAGLQASYDKMHLVPFGEYLPFEPVLRALGLRHFIDIIGGFSPGRSRLDFPVAGLPPVIPLICYEVIFPHEIVAGSAGAGLFLNVTNDSWFGNTPGPWQHLAQARLRAVEFGQPMIRAANGGISAVIDSYGRIVGLLPLNVADILDERLPAGLESTLYRRLIRVSYGSVMICLLIVALTGMFSRRGARQKAT